jgi:hypothetical protein
VASRCVLIISAVEEKNPTKQGTSNYYDDMTRDCFVLIFPLRSVRWLAFSAIKIGASERARSFDRVSSQLITAVEPIFSL